MTSWARYFKAGGGSSRPHWRWLMGVLACPKANPSGNACVPRLRLAGGWSDDPRSPMTSTRHATGTGARRRPTVYAGRLFLRWRGWAGCRKRRGSTRRLRRTLWRAPSSPGGVVNGRQPADDFQACIHTSTSQRLGWPWAIASVRQLRSEAIRAREVSSASSLMATMPRLVVWAQTYHRALPPIATTSSPPRMRRGSGVPGGGATESAPC